MNRESRCNGRTELHETAQRLAGVGGWEYDLEADRLYWTDEVRQMYELPASEPTLQEAIERFHPTDQPEIRSTIEAAMEGEAFDAEWRLETPTGGRRWVRVHGEPHGEGRSVVRIRGAIVDITDRKQHSNRLEARLETSRELLEATTAEEIAARAVDWADEVLGVAVTVVYLYDTERNTLHPAAGSSSTDIEKHSSVEPGGGVVWQAFECGDQQVDDPAETTTAAVQRELAVPLGDHGVFLVGSTDPTGFDDRTLSLATGLAADIETGLDRVARETEPRETSEQLETIIQHMPDALFVLDEGGQVIEANEQAYASLGYDTAPDDEPLLGSHWRTFGTVIDDGDPLTALRETPESVVTVEGRHSRRDGSTFPVRCRVTRIDDGEGGYLAIARDISERASQQRQLQRQNDQLEQFASVISHDLRSPLSVAQAGVEVARRTGEGHGDSLDRASQAHERMKTLIEKLLRLARNGQTLDEADLEAVELSDVVHRSWQTVDTETATLSVDVDCCVVADEPRLRQLVENLIRNSLDHGGDDLTVQVGPLPDGFYIADSGSGIPETKRERIFEPGYTTSDEGTGYGLQIVRTVAEAHGWSVTAGESASGGARFEITGVENRR